MASPSTPMPISRDVQKTIVGYFIRCQDLYSTSYNIRAQLEQRDRAYYREQDWTQEQLRARGANQTGDPTKLQNVTIPVVMPQVESALAYQAGIFLQGYPIFATVAPPQYKEAIKQFDTICADNAEKSSWPIELLKTIRDGLKYDLGAIEVEWKKKKIFSVGTPELANMAEGSQQEDLYEGNFMKRIDPYNLILDTRVSPDENHIKGEFAGYTEMVSHIQLKMEIADMDPTKTMNVKDAFESGTGTVTTNAADAGFYIPTINPDALLPTPLRTEQNWLQWAGLETSKDSRINYKSSYERAVLYVRLIPDQVGMSGVPAPNQVQIWKFIIINRQWCIYAERLTNVHGYLPIIVCKPSNDGMGWQSKSFAQNAEPYQQVASGLVNSAMASQRRKVYDRILYDPTRVRKQDIENTSPVARIPVKNSQFGKGFEGVVQAMPYNDGGVQEPLTMSQQVVQMGDMVNGQNRVQQGQFVKGNKTRREFETVMGAANARQQMSALVMEYGFFVAIKTIIKANILQYQPPKDVFNAALGETVKINPTDMRQAMIKFKMTDGLQNSEKIASLDVANTIIQAATQIPLVAQKYDVMALLDYTWTLQGFDALSDFERDETGQAKYLSELAANTQASGEMPPQPPAPAGIPDAGAQGAGPRIQ